MSSRSVHPSRFLVAALLGALALPMGASAQGPSPAPDAPPGPTPAPAGTPTLPPSTTPADRCAAWDATAEASRSVSALAFQRGGAVSDAGTGLAQVTPDQCSLGTVDPASLFDRDAIDVANAFGISSLIEALDRSNDSILLDGSVPATLSPSADLTGTFYGRTTSPLSKKDSRKAGRFLESLPDIAFGVPPEQWLYKGGEFELAFLHIADDPLADLTQPRVFQMGFQGRNPDKTVPATLTDINPLAGIQELLTVYVDAGSGDDQIFIGMSDFGSSKLGPDGTSQYYNASPTAAAAFLPDGLLLVYPAALDPLGFRPMIFDTDSGTWDLGNAPNGPLSFIPASGSASAFFAPAALFVNHTPQSVDDVVIDGGAPQTFPGPSHKGGIFRSPIFGGLEAPPVLDVSYEVDGHTFAFTSLPGVGEGDMYTFTWPIPQYGTYAYQAFQFRIADGTPLPVPETWDDLREMAQALGASRFTVDQQQGIYGFSAFLPYGPAFTAVMLDAGGFPPE